MKVAVIGSRSLTVNNLEKYLPPETSDIISGGAKGVDTSAKEYAIAHGINLIEILPNYNQYGRGAPLKRNIEIISCAELVLAFWDGNSTGIKFVIDHCKKANIPIYVFCQLHKLKK